jgi:hypothetical protein
MSGQSGPAEVLANTIINSSVPAAQSRRHRCLAAGAIVDSLPTRQDTWRALLRQVGPVDHLPWDAALTQFFSRIRQISAHDPALQELLVHQPDLLPTAFAGQTPASRNPLLASLITAGFTQKDAALACSTLATFTWSWIAMDSTARPSCRPRLTLVSDESMSDRRIGRGSRPPSPDGFDHGIATMVRGLQARLAHHPSADGAAPPRRSSAARVWTEHPVVLTVVKR